MALLTVSGAGCAPAEEDDAEDRTHEESLTYCDAEIVIEEKCVRCHSEDGDAETPFHLTSYEGVYEQRVAIERVVKNGFMPFVELDLDPEVEPLTDAEKEILLDWLEHDAPAGDCE